MKKIPQFEMYEEYILPKSIFSQRYIFSVLDKKKGKTWKFISNIHAHRNFSEKNVLGKNITKSLRSTSICFTNTWQVFVL